MARPQKNGLDYFPLDCGFFNNFKIKALRRTRGAIGVLTYLNILCKVYEKGYYLCFDSKEQLAYDIAEEITNDQLARTVSSVTESINYLVESNMIEKSLFKRGVITSRAIQEQYKISLEKSKRTIKMDEFVLDEQGIYLEQNQVNSEETPVNTEETQVNTELSTQSKIKESKVNKSKVNKEGTPPTPSRAPSFNPISILDSEICEGLPDDLKEKLKSWFKYKSEKKQGYKEQGFKTVMKRIFVALETNSVKEICDLIDASMVSNWQGLFFEKLPKHSAVEPPKSEVKYGKVI